MNAYRLTGFSFTLGTALLVAAGGCEGPDGRVGSMLSANSADENDSGSGSDVRECTPGDAKILPDGCNACSCTAEGNWLCSNNPCPEAGVCPPPRPPQPGEVCLQANTWARDPVAGTCCEYPHSCAPPTGWPVFNSQEACQIGEIMCGPPRPFQPGPGCPLELTFAKNPRTGFCCAPYSSPCEAPEGWRTFSSRAACDSGEEIVCPAPRPFQPGPTCAEELTWAKNPRTGTCCAPYSSPCEAPEGWLTFSSQAACEGSGCQAR
jgi:hypothetical protein